MNTRSVSLPQVRAKTTELSLPNKNPLPVGPLAVQWNDDMPLP